MYNNYVCFYIINISKNLRHFLGLKPYIMNGKTVYYVKLARISRIHLNFPKFVYTQQSTGGIRVFHNFNERV